MTYFTNGLNLAKRQDIEHALVSACKADGRRQQFSGKSLQKQCAWFYLDGAYIVFLFFFLSPLSPTLKGLAHSIHLYVLGVQAIDWLELAIKSEKGSQSEQDCGNL